MRSHVLSQRLVPAWLVAAALFLGVLPAPAQALTFDLHYENSDPPSYDPSGANLSFIMSHVASYYSRIIRDPFTLTIHYKWDAMDMDTLAMHHNDGMDGPREDAAVIQFNRLHPWYIDPSPADNSEYNMSSQIYNSLGLDKKLAWFNGLPPPTLEVGYRGGATAGVGFRWNRISNRVYPIVYTYYYTGITLINPAGRK
jgi:hypothetical protein